MRNNCFLLVILFVLGFVSESTANDSIELESFESLSDSTRLAELDLYWNELTRTVKEGDYEGYGAAYHPDAVVVFTNGKTKKSVPISTALLNWKQGFDNTKIGLTNDAVEFRLSQRIGNETTAHETGIFHYKSID
ncbi:MAG: hypothetical protein HKN51_06755, partial [Saprospiraceae bacterium]|nr:hypothetical protein [Saprospiraceae bacterium]